jgi:hypothetical protein
MKNGFEVERGAVRNPRKTLNSAEISFEFGERESAWQEYRVIATHLELASKWDGMMDRRQQRIGKEESPLSRRKGVEVHICFQLHQFTSVMYCSESDYYNT